MMLSPRFFVCLARQQCTDERMRQGLDHHITNPEEVAERAKELESLAWWQHRQESIKEAGAARSVRVAALGR